MRTILVVDDNHINRQILKSILGADYAVIEAENGKEALAQMHRQYAQISAVLLDILMPEMDGYAVLEKMRDNPMLSQIPVIVTTGNTEKEAEKKALTLGATDYVSKPFDAEIIKRRLDNLIKLRETSALVNALQRDKLTKLWNRETFLEKASWEINRKPEGYYALAYLDIDGFKIINDQFGISKGDEVLKKLAALIQKESDAGSGVCGRISGDNFAILFRNEPNNLAGFDTKRLDSVFGEMLPLPITVSVGLYVVDDKELSVSAMLDRATLAQGTVKHRYDSHVATYDEAMRKQLLQEQEITGEMEAALSTGQFEAWYQPQYNHATGAVIGAEALARWRHPKRGMISPGVFIPVFEKTGFVYELDRYIWRQVCYFLRTQLDAGNSPLPISVNISRNDLYRLDLVEEIGGLVEEYSLPKDLLRLEVTESAFGTSKNQVLDVVKQLIEQGFTVEIDDFGSGYSSLNMLKDMPAQVVKLDMRFMENSGESDHGGSIVESVVRMIKWLGKSIVAEGVETKEQADFLNSIGCNYIQGYLYAKPMPQADYVKHVQNAVAEETLIAMETVENLDNNAFWRPESMDTLIFNSYVGAASIIEYHEGRIEIIRSTKKFAYLVGGATMTVEQVLKLDLAALLDEADKDKLRLAVERSYKNKEDVTEEFVFVGLPNSLPRTYLRSSLRVIATAGNRWLVYCNNENITAQREAEGRQRRVAEQLELIMDNMNGAVTVTAYDDKTKLFSKLLFSNDAYFEMLGYTRAQFIKEVNDPFYCVFEEDKAAVGKALEHVAKSFERATILYRAVKKDGSIIWIRSNCAVRFNNDALMLIGISNDVTSEILSEKRVEELSENLRQMMDDLPGGFARMKLMPNGALPITHVNEKMCEMRGMSYEQLMLTEKIDAMQSVHPDDRSELTETLLRMLDKDGTCRASFRLKCGCGTYGAFSVFGRVTRSADGERYINLYFADMSNEEREAASFREKIPIVLSAIMNASADLAFAKDKDFRYICCSPAFVRFANKQTESQVIGHTDFELFPPEVAQQFRTADEKLFEGGESLIDYLEPIPSNDDVQHYSRTSKYILRDSLGTIIGLYGIGRDVTEEKTASERLKLVADNMPGGIVAYVKSPSGMKITYFNDGFCRMLGCTRQQYEEIAKEDCYKMVVKEDLPEMHRQLAALIENGTPLNNCFRAHRFDNGQLVWINRRGELFEKRGEEAYVNVALYDVTEQKEAEQAQAALYTQLQTVLGNVDGGIAAMTVTDNKPTYLFANEQYSAMFGYTRQQYAAELPRGLRDMARPCDVEKMDRLLEENERNAGKVSAEIRVKHRDGGYIWVHCTMAVCRLENVKLPVHVVILRDISARRAATEALRISEAEYRLTVEHLGGLIYRYNFADDSVDLPMNAAKALGVAPHVPNMPESLIAHGAVAEDSIEDYRTFFRAIKSKQREGSAALRRIINGKTRWFSAVFTTIFDEEQQPISAMVMYTDVTDQRDMLKHAELERERMYTALVNLLPEFISVNLTQNQYRILADTALIGSDVPREGKIDTLVKRLAASVEESQRSLFTESFSCKALLGKFTSGEKKVSLEYLRTALSGDSRWLLTQAFPVENPFDKDVQGIIFSRDITERMFAKAQLQKTYDFTIENMPNFVAKWLFKDGDVILLEANEKYLKFMGITAEAALGKSIIYEMCDEEKKKILSALYQFEKTRSNILYTERAVKANGEECWLRIQASFFEEQDGCSVYYGTLTDVSELIDAKDELAISREEYKTATSLSTHTIMRYDIRAQRVFLLSQGLTEVDFSMTDNVTPEQLKKLIVILPEYERTYAEMFEAITEGVAGEKTLLATLDVGGQTRWTEWWYKVIMDMDGTPATAIISVEDVTARKNAEKMFLFSNTFMGAADKVISMMIFNLTKGEIEYETDAEKGRITDRVGSKSLSVVRAFFLKNSVLEADAPAFARFFDEKRVLDEFNQGIDEDSFEYRSVNRYGETRWMSVRFHTIRDADSGDVKAYIIFVDIDDVKKEYLLVREQAELDPLTGVLNRVSFANKMDRIIADTPPKSQCALLMLDVDGFKQLNDNFGHAAGDQALIEIAQSIRSILRSDDLVGRLGGDEFLVCLKDISQNGDIERKAKQICGIVRKTFSPSVSISASIGIAVNPTDGDCFDALYRKADIALYTVKESGRDRHAFYRSDMRKVDYQYEPDTGVAPAPLVGEAKRRMLIVEDNHVNAQLLEELFKDKFHIDKAYDGNTALLRLRHYGSAISVVLLDLILPGIDGFAVLEKMRISKDLQSIPVIVVSGMDDREAGLRSIRCGATDYVAKPIDSDILRVRVESAVSKAENERLRAQNGLLSLQSDEMQKYRIALESTGTMIIEYNWKTGACTYDPSVSRNLAGNYDERKLWKILLSDFVADVRDVEKMQTYVLALAGDRVRQSGTLFIPLRTISGAKHNFRVTITKISNEFGLTDKLYLVLTDVSEE